MSEQIKALMVVLVLAGSIFFLLRRVVTPEFISNKDYRLAVLGWMVTTSAAFLSSDFWSYALLASPLFVWLSQRAERPLGLYLVLLVSVPPHAFVVPGPLGISSIIQLGHIEIMSIFFLIPSYSRLPARSDHRMMPYNMAIGYLVWICFLTLLNKSPTETIRFCLYVFLDFVLPLHFAIRTFSSDRDSRSIAAYLCLSAAVTGALASWETVRGWLLYVPIAVQWNLETIGYLTRGEGGLVRATASLIQPIVLGYYQAIALIVLPILGLRKRKPLQWVFLSMCLTAGLIASLSRGPWLGMLAGIFAFILTGQHAFKRACIAFLTLGAALSVLKTVPGGSAIIDVLPFIGSLEAQNVEYRSNLLDTSLEIFQENWLFGNFDYLSDPRMEVLRQTVGIIDIVNTYVGIALPFGVVGLLLFTSAFATSILLLLRAGSRPEPDTIRRSQISAIVCTLLVIGTTSSIYVLPIIYWLLLGWSIALLESRRRTQPE